MQYINHTPIPKHVTDDFKNEPISHTDLRTRGERRRKCARAHLTVMAAHRATHVWNRK